MFVGHGLVTTFITNFSSFFATSKFGIFVIFLVSLTSKATELPREFELRLLHSF